LLVATPAAAQNLRDVPLGARTATMGGAGVANGIDSAMPFLNPAGVAGTSDNTLSLSATAYSFVTASVPRLFAPGGLNPAFNKNQITEEDFSITQRVALPTGLAYFAHFNSDDAPVGHVLSLSISVPSYEDRSINGSLVAVGPDGLLRADEIRTEKFRMAFIGPTYALRTGRFRFGVSVLAYYADATLDDHFMFSTNGPLFVNSRSQIDSYSIGLTGIAGGQVRLADSVFAGLSIESRGLPLFGGGSLSNTNDKSNPDATNVQTSEHLNTAGEPKFDIARPFRFSAGVAYDKPSSFAVAADAHLHPAGVLVSGTGTARTLQSKTGAPLAETTQAINFSQRTKTLLNVSLGGEVHVSEKIDLRAGVYTDLDAIEDETNGVENNRLDWYGVTLGVGHKWSGVGATYGVVYRYGLGTSVRPDTLGPDPNQIAVVDYVAHGFMAVLSSTIEFSAPVDALVVGARRKSRAF
jgi:hypothetical protein